MVTRYFPSSGEPWQGRSAYQTLRQLARMAEVQVFYPNAAYPAVLSPRSRLYRRLDPTYSPAEVKVSYHDYAAVPLLSRPLNGWLAARAVLPAIRAFRPDVLFSIFLYPEGYAALQIGRKLGIPVVAMGIGSDIHSIADPLSDSRTRKVLRDADFIVTVSDDLRKRALAMGADPQRSRAVVNGADLSVFRPRDRRAARLQLGLAAEAPTVVYIGRMDLNKGLRELVEASTRLQKNRTDLQVYLVGEGADRAAVVAAIDAAKASAFVHACSPCAPDEVPTWMAAADVVTLPSYMEGCPNVVLEALACGRPVVATNVGGIPEILNDSSGRLIPPRDAGALAEALEDVLARTWDPEQIAGSNGRSWKAVAEELKGIFDQTTGERLR